MSNFFYNKIFKKLKNIKNISHKKIIILGITYKKNVSDLRNSLALEVYKRLKKKYHSIKVYDPYVDRKYSKKYDLIKKEKLRNFDVYIPLTNHDAFLKIKKYLKIKNIIDPYS
jgi:UDP-N-acetyl-D-mannosaminuronate dehydrogenase